jgi:hypothetical protein
MLPSILRRVAQLEAVLEVLAWRQRPPGEPPYDVVYLADGEEPPASAPGADHGGRITLYVQYAPPVDGEAPWRARGQD